MKKVTWLRTLVTVVLSVTVVSMVYVFTKGWPYASSQDGRYQRGDNDRYRIRS